MASDDTPDAAVAASNPPPPPPGDSDEGPNRASHPLTKALIGFNERAEAVIAIAVVLLLIATAALLLWSGANELWAGTSGGEFALTRALSDILLALMIAEIIGTVSSFLRRGVFDPVPFLVVAIIASVRRLLVLSAETAELLSAGEELPIAFLGELAILAATIGICSWSIGYLRTRTAN